MVRPSSTETIFRIGPLKVSLQNRKSFLKAFYFLESVGIKD